MNRPNILLIMTDQLRADWLEITDTPNIDRLKKEGVSFTRTVCNSPLCAPSRCSIAAGVYPHRLGVLSNKEVYPLDHPTYYQALRRAGYRVGLVGKSDLHKPRFYLGDDNGLPFMYHLGFTDVLETEGKMHAGRSKKYQYEDSQVKEMVDIDEEEINIDREELSRGFKEKDLLGPYQRYLKKNNFLLDFVDDYWKRLFGHEVWYAAPSVLPVEHFEDSFIGREACSFLEKVGSDYPWHLFVSFVGPHDPWDAPEEYYQKYKELNFCESIKDEMYGKPEYIKYKQNRFSNKLTTEAEQEVKCHYTAMINLIDEWIGKMIDVLYKRNLLKDTVIVFTSDHGEMLGDHGLYRKKVMYEPALRVPLIISGDDYEQGESNALVELVDLFPSFLDMAGIDYDRLSLDGKSLVPILNSTNKKHKDYQLSELDNCQMICDGRYKLIENYNDITELYNLGNDPDELYNIAEKCTGKVSKLSSVIKKIRL